MTKFLRFAGVALLALTIGVASCGDDADPVAPTVTVTVPTPPTPPTPPPPPVVVTMAPPSQTIGVGGTVVFAISVSGGVAGEAATWTCASSDESKATAIVTPEGCAATAVAAGGASIIAAVTKGGATFNTAAALTITEDMAQAASLFIASIKDSDSDSDEDDGVLSRRVSVTLSVELGDQMITQLSVLVDEVVAEILSFEGASMVAASQDEPAQQAVHPFVLSFNSAHYDPLTGKPTYMNGERTISAQLMVASSDEPIESGFHAREFGNGDGVYVTVSGVTKEPVVGADGGYWYGGPDAGFDLRAIPVVYSERPVPSVTLREGFCGDNDAIPLTEGPYDFTPDCDGFEGLVEAQSFSIGAAPVETLNADEEFFLVQLDYAGPDAPVFRPNPNGREAGWINDMVDLAGKHITKSGSTKNLDGWLFYGETDEGVGGYTAQLQVGEDIEEALDATASSTPGLPAAASKAAAYCFVASAVDDLGNRSDLPTEAAGCADPDKSQLAMDAVVDDPDTEDIDEEMAEVMAVLFSSITAGVDTEAPTLEFTGASAGARDDDGPDRVATLKSEFEVQVKDNDDGSGVHRADPVLATLSIRNADGEACRELGNLEKEDKECAATFKGLTEALPLVSTDGVGGRSDDTGYYTFTALAQDRAGNQSGEISEVALYDIEVPVVQLSTTRSTAFDEDFTLNKVLVATDNLSLRDYTVNLVATAAPVATLPAEFAMGSSTWDEYDGPDPLTRDDVVRGPVELPFIAIQGTTSGEPDEGPLANFIENTRVTIRDQVDGRTTGEVAANAPTGITAVADGGSFHDEVTSAVNLDRTNVEEFTVSHDAGMDNIVEDSKSSIELTATAVVVGKIKIVTVTQTTDGEVSEDDPSVTVTDVSGDASETVGTTEVTFPVDLMEGTDGEVTTFTTTETVVKLLPKPFSSVNFYATDDVTTDQTASDASEFRLITSVSDLRAKVKTDTDSNRVWTYAITVSADEYYAIVDGDDGYKGSIVAVGVNENGKGVALASGAVMLDLDER